MPMFVRIRLDCSSCRIWSVRSFRPTESAGVTAGMNWPYVPLPVSVYVRRLTTRLELDGVVDHQRPGGVRAACGICEAMKLSSASTCPAFTLELIVIGWSAFPCA